MVIQAPAFRYILSLKGDLEAAAPHPKRHCIHIYMIFFSSPITDIVIFRPFMKIVIDSRVFERPGRILISKYRYVDFHLTPSP